MPEDFLRKIKGAIKSSWKIAFISAFLIGFLTHMYVFTNLLPNHDGLLEVYSAQDKFTSGRFFLGIISGISSYFSLPWLNGSLAVLYLSLMAVVIVEILDLRKTPSILLTSGIIVTFPTVGATFSYMFTADGYMGALLLASLAILVTKKYKYGFIFGAILLLLSVGVYQANITFVMTLVTLWFIKELLFMEHKILKTLLTLLRFVAMSVIGMLLYAGMFYLYRERSGGNVTSYQGLDKIGQQNEGFFDVITKIRDTFQEFLFGGFVVQDAPINLFEILNVVLVSFIVLGIIVSIFVNKMYLKPLRLLFIIISVLLLPIFSFILYFVSPGVFYHMLMVMAVIAIYLLPLVIYDSLSLKSISVKIYSWGAVLLVSIIVFNFMIINNISYFNMALRYEKSYAFTNRLLARIEQTEGFDEEKKIAVIGKPNMKKTYLYSKIVKDKIPYMMGAMGDTFLVENYHVIIMLNDYFGQNFHSATGEDVKKIQQLDFYEEMEPWPSQKSIHVYEDFIIVKLS